MNPLRTTIILTQVKDIWIWIYLFLITSLECPNELSNGVKKLRGQFHQNTWDLLRLKVADKIIFETDVRAFDCSIFMAFFICQCKLRFENPVLLNLLVSVRML